MLHQKEALICWLQNFVLSCTIFWCFYRNILLFFGVTHHSLWCSLGRIIIACKSVLLLDDIVQNFLACRLSIFSFFASFNRPTWNTNSKKSHFYSYCKRRKLYIIKLAHSVFYCHLPHLQSRNIVCTVRILVAFEICSTGHDYICQKSFVYIFWPKTIVCFLMMSLVIVGFLAVSCCIHVLRVSSIS